MLVVRQKRLNLPVDYPFLLSSTAFWKNIFWHESRYESLNSSNISISRSGHLNWGDKRWITRKTFSWQWYCHSYWEKVGHTNGVHIYEHGVQALVYYSWKCIADAAAHVGRWCVFFLKENLLYRNLLLSPWYLWYLMKWIEGLALNVFFFFSLLAIPLRKNPQKEWPSRVGLQNTPTASNKCPGCDTKQFDGEAPVMLEFWRMLSPPYWHRYQVHFRREY